ncbi:MAG: hypothetical protein JNK15_04525 [Planctomycetes bacterium]|nr:hypothetical protein [Planctomycetota bacterium]
MAGAAGLIVPNVLSANLNRNESAAIAALKNISSGQSQMQASGLIDENGNGAGEYGFFAEMAGAVPSRGGRVCSPPVLSPRFGRLDGGRVHTGGYVFQMFLRGPDGTWVAEAANGGAASVAVDASRAELEWLCYAWPESRDWSGKRAFLMTQGGDVLASNLSARAYGGEVGPEPGVAGFRVGGSEGAIAANEIDAFGNMWVVV